MDFITFDEKFKEILPKDLSKIVYEYYDTSCYVCKIEKSKCSVCDNYFCKTTSCINNCVWCSVKMSCCKNFSCNHSVLCSYCWYRMS